MTASTPREDVRAARRRQRQGERRRRAAERARERAKREAIAAAVRETRQQWPSCRCELRGVSTYEQLRAMRSCCDPQFICPRLDSIRRRVGA